MGNYKEGKGGGERLEIAKRLPPPEKKVNCVLINVILHHILADIVSSLEIVSRRKKLLLSWGKFMQIAQKFSAE